MPIAVPLIAAGIGAAGTAYAGSQANKATQRGIDAQTQAANQNYQLQQQALQAALQNNAPFIQGGAGAISQLQQLFGLGAGGATPGTPVGGATPGSPDLAGYLNANPDVARDAPRIARERGDVNGDGTINNLDGAAWHFANYGQGEGRQMPTVATPAQTPAAGGQQAGTGAAYGPQIGERPTFTRPDVGTAPGLPSLSTEAYRESPGFQNRLRQAGRSTNAQFAARGLLGSGAAAEEFGRRMQNIADEDYDAWVNQQLGLYDRSVNQYNLDRNRLDTIFGQDRAYGTGVYDADRSYLTSRFDTNVNDLFRMAGLGQASANQSAAAQGNYAANVGNQANTLANNLSSAYGQQAQNNATMWGNLAGIGQNVLSNWGGTTRAQTRTPDFNPNVWSQSWGGGS